MRNDLATDLSHERYVVEVDGIAKAGIPSFREGTESQLTAKARASELLRQTARRWRRDGALIFVASAKALQVDRHFFGQWQIARVEALNLFN